MDTAEKAVLFILGQKTCAKVGDIYQYLYEIGNISIFLASKAAIAFTTRGKLSMMDSDLTKSIKSNMNIIITGASRGIGRDLAILLAKDKLHEILVLSRSEEKLKSLTEEHENIHYIKYDLSNPDTSVCANWLEKWEEIDILINNAGLLIKKPFEELTSEDWQRSFEVNLFGVVRLIQLCLPKMKKGFKGHIVNISSMGGVQGSAKFPELSAYSTSKAALANLTEILAEELKDENIAINALALGAVQTEMLEEAFPGYIPPLQSIEMAEFIANFALKGAKFFNGKILPVSTSTP